MNYVKVAILILHFISGINKIVYLLNLIEGKRELKGISLVGSSQLKKLANPGTNQYSD